MSLKRTGFNSFDELKEYAKKNGLEISDICLEEVSGGIGEVNELPMGWKPPKCPKCGSNNIKIVWVDWEAGVVFLKCKDCGHEYMTAI